MFKQNGVPGDEQAKVRLKKYVNGYIVWVEKQN
jgi:hypothetical protein